MPKELSFRFPFPGIEPAETNGSGFAVLEREVKIMRGLPWQCFLSSKGLRNITRLSVYEQLFKQ
jgi:hypothetical protein